MTGPIDSFGRSINYLRISVTDRCNLRCLYCMPPEGVPRIPHSEILSYEEIRTVVRAAAELGINKIRLTGGEPLVRAELPKLIHMLSQIEGIQELSLTTNGTILKKVHNWQRTCYILPLSWSQRHYRLHQSPHRTFLLLPV